MKIFYFGWESKRRKEIVKMSRHLLFWSVNSKSVKHIEELLNGAVYFCYLAMKKKKKKKIGTIDARETLITGWKSLKNTSTTFFDET